MKVYATNRDVFHHYEILDRYTAGIALFGDEVKSIRASRVNLKGSYIKQVKNQLFIVNMDITPYQNSSADREPKRTRALLLNKSEINRLGTAQETKGITIVPLKIGAVGQYIKVEIATARGKKLYDKRQSAKKKIMQREAQREISKK